MRHFQQGEVFRWSVSEFEQLEGIWKDINDLLSSDILDYPRIRVCDSNNAYSKGYSGFMRYAHSPHGERKPMIHKDLMLKSLRDGCTLVINRCESFFDWLESTCDYLSDVLCSAVSANLYISWAEKGGFGIHFDDHDVIAFQILGTKRWEIYEPTVGNPGVAQKSFYFPPPSGSPIRIECLESLNAVYLPSGYWHDVYTESGPSVHVSFTLNRPRRIDFLRHVLRALESDSYFRSNITNEDFEEQSIARFRERFTEKVHASFNPVMLDQATRSYRNRSPFEFTLPDIEGK